MTELRIWDETFRHAPSAGSPFLHPKKVRWRRTGPDTEVTFFTDLHLGDHRVPDIVRSPAKHKIAWIVEPWVINASPYHWIKQNFHLFSMVLTHTKNLLPIDPRFKYCPIGGCWIAEEHRRGLPTRTDRLSIIASGKVMTSLQQLRHDVVRELAAAYNIGKFGDAYQYIKFKHEVLGCYEYSIVIENCVEPGYFTEKLTDCLACHCVPLYCGDPTINELFDMSGIPTFSDIPSLRAILDNLPVVPTSVKEHNYKVAERYFIPDDWIMDEVVSKL